MVSIILYRVRHYPSHPRESGPCDEARGRWNHHHLDHRHRRLRRGRNNCKLNLAKMRKCIDNLNCPSLGPTLLEILLSLHGRGDWSHLFTAGDDLFILEYVLICVLWANLKQTESGHFVLN